MLNASARTSPALRKLGLVGDAVALWSRATRKARAWSAHEARSRAFVEEVVDALPSRRTALLLGSGLLRDVPIEQLADRFDRVILLDAVHLLPARIKARRLGCEVGVADLTGAAEWLLGRASTRTDPLAAYSEDREIDLVVSAMLLSQLPISLERRVARGRPVPADMPADLGAAIREAHLAALRRFACAVCLLTDVSYRDVDLSGRLLDETSLAPELSGLTRDAEWDWEVAPAGEIARGFARIHRVRAWRDFRHA